jgi:hypothetical protein
MTEADQNLGVAYTCQGKAAKSARYLVAAVSRQEFAGDDYTGEGTGDPFGQLDCRLRARDRTAAARPRSRRTSRIRLRTRWRSRRRTIVAQTDFELLLGDWTEATTYDPLSGGASARGGVYVTVGSDGGVDDIGVRAGTSAGVTVGPTAVSIAGPSTSISFVEAFVGP